MAIYSIKLNQASFDELEIGMSSLPLDEHPLALYPLGKTVVLAGPNGAGKTRLLKLIKDLAPKLMSPGQERGWREARSRTEEERNLLSSKIVNSFQIPLGQSDAPNNDLRRQISEKDAEIARVDKALRSLSYIQTSSQDHHPILSFVPRTSVLEDPSNAADLEVRGRSELFKNGMFDAAGAGAPAYARSVLRASQRAFVDRIKEEKSEATAPEANEARLLGILKRLLGPSIQTGLNEDFNLRIGVHDKYWEALSEGQQILFQFACMLHSHAAQIEHCILLMDEPENYLHPGVLNEVIDSLKAALGKGTGQLWIATHSVPLIAHLASAEPDCLWYAKDGQFSRAGLTPNKVLQGLMGGADGADDLRAFTMLPAQYSALRFMAECLVEPGVVGPNIKDPQNLQIAQVLEALANTVGERIRVLDFGAGVGRLLPTLVAMAPNQDLQATIDYRAYEPDTGKHKALTAELDTVYGACASDRVFGCAQTMCERLGAGSVHIVVMCNVLHEVHPAEWTSLFGPTGTLTSVIADDGYLLIVEDYGIPAGERAHEFGFFLLDESELALLFDIQEADRTENRFVRQSSVDPKYLNRLVAHLIAKSCLQSLTPDTRKSSIQELCRRMLNEVTRSLKAPPENPSHKDGTEYARSAQLLTNASIWLDAQED